MGDLATGNGGIPKIQRRRPRPVVWLLAGAGTIVALFLAVIVAGWILFWAQAPSSVWENMGRGPTLSEIVERPLTKSAIGWMLLKVNVINPFDRARFDRVTWLAMRNSDDPDNPRGPMAEDVRRIVLKQRMTREQVRDFLGPPDFREEPGLWMYVLGMWSGFRFDYDTLDIHFDGNGRVTEMNLHQH